MDLRKLSNNMINKHTLQFKSTNMFTESNNVTCILQRVLSATVLAERRATEVRQKSSMTAQGQAGIERWSGC